MYIFAGRVIGIQPYQQGLLKRAYNLLSFVLDGVTNSLTMYTHTLKHTHCYTCTEIDKLTYHTCMHV